MSDLDKRLAALEASIPGRPEETKRLFVWLDPENGETRNDEPPADFYNSHEWLTVEVSYGQNARKPAK